jgi:hypothetical protein
MGSRTNRKGDNIINYKINSENSCREVIELNPKTAQNAQKPQELEVLRWLWE